MSQPVTSGQLFLAPVPSPSTLLPRVQFPQNLLELKVNLSFEVTPVFIALLAGIERIVKPIKSNSSLRSGLPRAGYGAECASHRRRPWHDAPHTPGPTAAPGTGVLTASRDAGTGAIFALTVPGIKSETQGPLHEGAKASVGPDGGGAPLGHLPRGRRGSLEDWAPRAGDAGMPGKEGRGAVQPSLSSSR